VANAIRARRSRDIPARRWIYGQHYIRGHVSVLASAGGVGKTSLQIVEALCIGTGKPLLGEAIHEPCKVWIINLEDPLEEMQRRLAAAMLHYGVTAEEIRGRLFLDAGSA
jgi:RecA-family ATPase